MYYCRSVCCGRAWRGLDGAGGALALTGGAGEARTGATPLLFGRRTLRAGPRHARTHARALLPCFFLDTAGPSLAHSPFPSLASRQVFKREELCPENEQCGAASPVPIPPRPTPPRPAPPRPANTAPCQAPAAHPPRRNTAAAAACAPGTVRVRGCGARRPRPRPRPAPPRPAPPRPTPTRPGDLAVAFRPRQPQRGDLAVAFHPTHLGATFECGAPGGTAGPHL
jgi:hypothetical protein